MTLSIPNTIKKMPAELQNNYERYVSSLQNHDISILHELELISDTYKNPVINNLLYNCLILADRYADALKVAENNFTTFPDYVFGRLTYASALIGMEDYKSIPRVFNFKFDLKSIAPNRNTFHISEVLSFHKIIFCYHIGIHELENANKHFEIIQKLDHEGSVKRDLEKLRSSYKRKKYIELVFGVIISPFILIYIVYSAIKTILSRRRTTRQ